jgi:hypothetical protein
MDALIGSQSAQEENVGSNPTCSRTFYCVKAAMD